MKTAFEQIRFTIESTKDGSPTLKSVDSGESMHHSGGAASETKYIYKSVLEAAYKIRAELKICVVGLGLAYIEIAWAQVLIGLGVKPERLDSFESVSELKENFIRWIQTETNDSIYDQVCRALDQDCKTEIIKNILNENVKKFSLGGDLTHFQQEVRWNVICYDAFSSKTTENLWSEEFLNYFIESHCDDDCVFTTYASTGKLKKVLQRQGFTLIKRPGFSGKRESTLAVRGIFTAYLKNFY